MNTNRNKLLKNATQIYLELQSNRKEAYDGGYDCGLYGPNEKNCHCRFFDVDENRAAWEEGKFDAEHSLPNKYTK